MSSPTRRARARKRSISSSPDEVTLPRRVGARRVVNYRAAARPNAELLHCVLQCTPAKCVPANEINNNKGAAMMILRSSPASPFGRKVRIAISVLGLDDDGTAYYDSRVILDYLDDRSGGGNIVPRDAKARLQALRLQALCDGILDASILTIY